MLRARPPCPQRAAVHTTTHLRAGSRAGLRRDRPTAVLDKRQAAQEEAEQAYAALGPLEEVARRGAGCTPYPWSKQWWPVAIAQDLDPAVPTPRNLLGDRLVLWRDGQGEWRCFEDKCPHRLAPLSEGCVERSKGGATLMCSYHGWEFRGDGSCAKVPQATEARVQAAALANPRSCAVARPCQVRQGLVWVWGDAGPARFVEAAATPPQLAPTLDPHARGLPTRFADGSPLDSTEQVYYREVPYGWDVLMQNLSDPAHLPYAHHSILGSRTNPHAGAVVMGPAEPSPYGGEGLAMPFTGTLPYQKGVHQRRWVWHPPHTLMWETLNEKGECWMLLVFHLTPLTAHKSSFIMNVAFKKAAMPLLFRVLVGLLPPFTEHLSNNQVLDSDTAILYHQERLMAAEQQASGRKWDRAFFMPTVADRAVVAMQRWLDTRGGGGPLAQVPALAAGRQPLQQVEELSQERLLDRYDQHTRHCRRCQRVVATLGRLRALAAAFAVLCALGLCAVLGRGARALSAKPAALLAGALLGAALVKAASAIRQQFFFVPWSHARNG